MLNNFDLGHVVRHPLFLVTFIIAVPAWIIAFAGQCAAEAKFGRNTDGTPAVRYLWYSIWIQLACIIHLFLATCTDGLAVHRFQLAVVLVIAEVFAVFGTEYIFTSEGAFIAVGVGSLLLAMVDLVWILYLTSEEDTLFYNVLNAGGNGGLSSHSRRQARRDSAAAFAGGETGIGNVSGYQSTPRINGSYSMGYAPAATDTTPQKNVTSYDHATPPVSDEQYKHRAKAMYAYSASPDDPNEVSFAKGDILEVMDNTGKWYQVRTPSGQTGIAPSNYLSPL
ncbi:hypothetical protein BCR39DRAFT_224863 [Naematelia encephala]|uniref:SH3 domain-containing protein n=1 Tax=Naematelia encephala TaxID=71784 RepID=A0A1Y2AZL8_9TREE|nr:hypothetical protein BCR39DRAFT_224863 [Naematelia encephala]